MSLKHLTRRTGGHLQKDPITGHLVKTCHTPGGGHPCTVACEVIPPEGHVIDCCYISEGLDPTPDSRSVTITGVAVGVCDFDTAAPYHVFLLSLMGLIGATFCLPYDGGFTCSWSGTFDVTGMVKLLRCYGSAPNSCNACVPSTDITVKATLYLSMTPSGGLSATLGIISSDPEWSPAGVERLTNFGTSTDTSDFVDCCTAATYTSSADPTGTGGPVSGYITSYTMSPCC